ncbi:MAG: ribose transport system ATP-binding protein/rhamnose transport system ATP-binding protein [Verrucomicrobia bacterium]|nr:MAG: ribose transport system ATP-binding protein/rhamnose transport system ATP-binding protein [Verrucomicrobiota bacterium]
MIGAPPLLEMRGIVKSFPGVKALRGVDLALHAGEVLALLGENGAGKSTLMRILGGAQRADAGTLLIDGCETPFNTPQDSQAAGVAVIYQEFNLVPGLTAVENIFLGRETTRAGLIDKRSERERARKLFERLGADIDLDTPCRRLSTAQQQLVEIAKALAFDARILVMDEPSAALTAHEVGRLFEIIRDLRSQKISIIYISHRLDEVFEITDRVTVLRDGLNVGDRPTASITRAEMIQLMVGRKLTREFPQRTTIPGPTRLEVSGLRHGRAVCDVSFSVGRGEILALTGLVGAGRTETMRLLFGADPREAGEIRLDGRLLSIGSPSDAIAAGIGFLTEDRKTQGLVLAHSVLENFALPNLQRLSHQGFVRERSARDEFSRYVKQLQIAIPSEEQRAGNLSGGNQQKVVLAKWLARHCELLIFDEPTRGIDVGAKFEIYLLMNELVAAGKSIIMISSELPEVLGMADRILVMHEGRITGEIADPRSATQEQIMRLAIA